MRQEREECSPPSPAHYSAYSSLPPFSSSSSLYSSKPGLQEQVEVGLGEFLPHMEDSLDLGCCLGHEVASQHWGLPAHSLLLPPNSDIVNQTVTDLSNCQTVTDLSNCQTVTDLSNCENFHRFIQLSDFHRHLQLSHPDRPFQLPDPDRPDGGGQ